MQLPLALTVAGLVADLISGCLLARELWRPLPAAVEPPADIEMVVADLADAILARERDGGVALRRIAVKTNELAMGRAASSVRTWRNRRVISGWGKLGLASFILGAALQLAGALLE